jgi:hypothetical protein
MKLFLSKKEKLKKRIELFWSIKKKELILNGVCSSTWVLPVTKEQFKDLVDFGYDFMQEFKDPVLQKKAEDLAPCIVLKKLGLTIFIKQITIW